MISVRGRKRISRLAKLFLAKRSGAQLDNWPVCFERITEAALEADRFALDKPMAHDAKPQAI